MTILMSFIMWGALAAAIPILVHLLHRQKTQPIQWGAMQFLLETPLKMRRRQRIDHWLLMLLRMAILLVLTFLLARPIIQGMSFSTETPMDVVFVLDHSLSMSRRTAGGAGGGETLFDNAIKTAEKIAAMLPQKSSEGGATVAVVLAEHSPQIITSLPVLLGPAKKGPADWPKILQKLRETKPGMTDANIPEAIQAATELAARGRNTRKLIIVISDDQRSNWAPGNDSAWRLTTASGGKSKSPDAAIPVYSIPITLNGSLPNISVADISVLPAFIGVHRPAQIAAAITNNSAADISNIPLRLFVDGRPVTGQSQQIPHLAPGQSVTARFNHAFTDSGSHAIRIKADLVDGLEADNTATAAVTVSPRLNVLIIDGQLTPSHSYPSAEYLLLAMQPSGAPGVDPSLDPAALIAPRVISVSEIATVRFEDFPIILLNDIPRLPADIVARLTDYTQKGNGLWIILGPRTEQSFLNNTLAKSPLFPATAAKPVHITPDASPVSADIKEPQNAAFAAMTAAQQNALAGVNFRAWWPITPTSPQMHTVLATTTGNPIILETDLGKTGGRVILWTTPDSGPDWNNLYISGGSVVPLVNETLFHLASSQSQTQLRQLNAGDPLLWSGPIHPTIESATIICPDGGSRSLQPQLRGDKYLLGYKDTFTPGLYELRFTPPEIPQPVFYSVNIDRTELDPATLATADVTWLREHHYLNDRLTLETLPKAMSAQRAGFELWPLLALLLVAFLLTEAAVTWFLAKKQTDIDVEHAGLVNPLAHRTPVTVHPIPADSGRLVP